MAEHPSARMCAHAGWGLGGGQLLSLPPESMGYGKKIERHSILCGGG